MYLLFYRLCYRLLLIFKPRNSSIAPNSLISSQLGSLHFIRITLVECTLVSTTNDLFDVINNCSIKGRLGA